MQNRTIHAVSIADYISADCITAANTELSRRNGQQLDNSETVSPADCIQIQRYHVSRNEPRRNNRPKQQRTRAARRNQTASSPADSPELHKKSGQPQKGIDKPFLRIL